MKGSLLGPFLQPILHLGVIIDEEMKDVFPSTTTTTPPSPTPHSLCLSASLCLPVHSVGLSPLHPDYGTLFKALPIQPRVSLGRPLRLLLLLPLLLLLALTSQAKKMFLVFLSFFQQVQTFLFIIACIQAVRRVVDNGVMKGVGWE